MSKNRPAARFLGVTSATEKAEGKSMDYGDLMRAEDYGSLAKMVKERMMVDVQPHQLCHVIRMYMFLYTQSSELRYQGKNADAYTWLKNRLQDGGLI